MAAKAKSSQGESGVNAFRTVVIIENSEELHSSAPEFLEIDSSQKGRSSFELHPSVQWSWLTWTAEACFEYCRIAWDIHPDYKIAIFACDGGPAPIEICPFEQTDTPVSQPGSVKVSLRDLRLRMIRLMSLNKNPQIVSDAAMETVFGHLESLQTDMMLSVPMFYDILEAVSSEQPFYVRFIIITTELEKQKVFMKIRKYIANKNVGYLARYEVAVVSVDDVHTLHPSYEKIDLNEEIYVTWYSVAAGMDVIGALKTCLTWDLRLSRTIVTDIPMREDVKSGGSTSVSYNVDLFHPCLVNDQNVKGRPGGEALRMKWVRPVKGVVPALIPVPNTQLIRASPSDPITRPTQCLVGYVLDKNAVLLENEAAHRNCKLFLCGDKISLQQLTTGTDPVIEDIPALSDLPGGRVSSYRVKEMVMLLSATSLDMKSFPLNRTATTESHIKMTRHFPIVYNDTIVYILPQFTPLLEAIGTGDPKQADWDAAKISIDEVMEMEKHNQTLPGLSSHALLQIFPGTSRRTEGYALIWAELDLLLEAYSDRSSEHAQLRNYLTRIKRSIREDLKNMIKARVKSRFYNGEPALTVISAAELSKKRKARPEFEGRLKFGRFGKLYLNLQKPEKGTREDVLIHASIEL